MLVYERMTRHPITVTPDVPIDEALRIMRDNKVRRLPVVSKKDKNKLVGIVSEKDLLYASPSPATSLSIHEIHYLISKITVADVMTGSGYMVSDIARLYSAMYHLVTM